MVSLGIIIIIWLMFAHWFADFVCQTDYWAKNKSKSGLVLALHVWAYSAIMFVAVALTGIGLANAFLFFGVCFFFHFWTDFVTSRITSKLAAKEDWHNFFVVIGFDQFLHFAQIFITYYLLTTT